MKTLLKDLIPGDEFEYVNTAPGYRKGRFLVLNTMGSYLRPVATDKCRFLYSFTAKKVVNHFVEQEIILKKFVNEAVTIPCYPNVTAFINDQNRIKLEEANMKSQKQMGHFVGWKFGVPVKIYEHDPGGRNYPEYEEARLIYEGDKIFVVVFNNKTMGSRSKQNFHYELIPHKYSSQFIDSFEYSPRYPVCQAPEYTAFYNDDDTISVLDAGKVKLYPTVAATLNIDGEVIELSAETAANIKAKLRRL